MTTHITVPALGESVSEATVAKWLKSVGDEVAVDDPLVELETDKVTLEVFAQSAGTLTEIKAEEGSEVEVGGVLGVIAEGMPKGAQKRRSRGIAAPKPGTGLGPGPAAKPAARSASSTAAAQLLSPAVRKLVDEHRLNPAAIAATGKNGRLTKADVLAYLESRKEAAAITGTGGAASAPAPGTPPAEAPQPGPGPAPGPPPQAAPRPAPRLVPVPPAEPPRPAPPPPAPLRPAPLRPEAPRPAARAPGVEAPREERVRMTQLRKLIAERLKEAQNTAAMLTTFNEVDMTGVLATRDRFRDNFQKKHGVRLGLMSFFVKAAIVALKEIPTVNAQVDGDELVYKNYYDIGVAVGTPQGLVVPVVRDADGLSFAQLEATIAELGRRAHDGKLSIEELSGGTFTISNGGIYGSLMSTPILNPPQSGILGMHKIEKRPVVIGDAVEVRPMMYLALSYDHRIVDGREAVTFLVRIKECIEDPQRILLDI